MQFFREGSALHVRALGSQVPFSKPRSLLGQRLTHSVLFTPKIYMYQIIRYLTTPAHRIIPMITAMNFETSMLGRKPISGCQETYVGLHTSPKLLQKCPHDDDKLYVIPSKICYYLIKMHCSLFSSHFPD